MWERSRPVEMNHYSQSCPAQHTSAGGSNTRAFERQRVAASYFERLHSRGLRRRVQSSVSPSVRPPLPLGSPVSSYLIPSDIEQWSGSIVFDRRASHSALSASIVQRFRQEKQVFPLLGNQANHRSPPTSFSKSRPSVRPSIHRVPTSFIEFQPSR